MKYQLETIPVRDSWASDTPCPVCALMEAAEKRHIQYYLGNSVMNPETRILANDTGFCSRHFPMMREAGHAHHLGLLGHTRLQSVRKKISGRLKALDRNPTPGSARAFSTLIRETLSDCLVCRSMDRDLKRYAYTAVVLHGEEEEFRRLFESSPGPCLPHAAELADMAAGVLNRKKLSAFLRDLEGHMNRTAAALEADILGFTRKFDAQNDAVPWGSSRDAHARTVQFLSGVPVRLKD